MTGERLQTAAEIADGWSDRVQAMIDRGAQAEEIAALMFEQAMIIGAVALEMHPKASNFLTGRTEQRMPDGTERFIGHTVRWLHGKGTDEVLAEREAEIERLQAEVARLRDRVRATPEDVAKAIERGLTGEKVRSWAASNELAVLDQWPGIIEPSNLSAVVRGWSLMVNRPDLDILDEMVAMDVEESGGRDGDD